MVLVSSRQNWTVQTPSYAHPRIIPGDAAVPLGKIEVAAFVQELSNFGHDQITVRKPRRNVQLALVVGGEKHALVTSELRRSTPNVYDDVKHFSVNHTAEFGLRPLELIVHSSQRTARGSGVVVLNEAARYSQFGILGFVIAFEKETALIAENRGLDQTCAV